MVERLVANEKVEGSTPFARSINIVLKSKLITYFFQRSLINKDIRIFKNFFFYYIIFRIIRNFLSQNILINIYNFKIFASIKKNKTSHYLLKKCDFGDNHELSIIKKISDISNILLLDCGCNYGFYTFYTASLSKKNTVIAVEASKNTSLEFLKNHKLNNFKNIHFENKAISNKDNENVIFNESDNDWESSQTHKEFKIKSNNNVQTITIDGLLNEYQLNEYKIIIKLDIEGNEMSAIQGSLRTIKNFSPLIILEVSKYIFDYKHNIDYFKNFLSEFDYSIFDLNNNKILFKDLLLKLKNLDKDRKTIGNFYLIKNSSNILKILKNE